MQCTAAFEYYDRNCPTSDKCKTGYVLAGPKIINPIVITLQY